MAPDLSQALLDILPQAILVINAQRQILALNKAARQLLPPEIEIGAHLDYAPIAALLNTIDSHTESFKQEITMNDGEAMEATLTPFPPYGWAIMLYDVSTYKAAEAQKNDLLDQVAHDLKQPISAIVSFSDVVRASGELNDHQNQYLDRVRTAANRMAEQIRELLDVSRLESGIGLKIVRADLVGLARTALDEIEPRASAKQIRLVLETTASSLELNADSSRLAQAISNLVLNAVKYSPAESTVNVKLWTLENQAAFSVADEGIGIAPENLPHVFDRFFRVRDKRTRNIEGSGLGLYIVQTIIEQHGGTISVESLPGKGSVFTVYLPLSGPY